MTTLERRARQLMRDIAAVRGEHVVIVYKDGGEKISPAYCAVMALLEDGGQTIARLDCGASHGLLGSLVKGMIEEVPR